MYAAPMNDIPAGWAQRQSRPVDGGDVILAERMRQADIGRKSIMVEEYGTWYVGDVGPVLGHYFDALPEAEQDFSDR